MSQNSEQYTQDFLKGQEVPETRRGYLVGNLPLAGKYNPQGLKKLLPIMYLYVPAALISAALFFVSWTLWEKILFAGIFLASLWGIYRTMKKIS
jgi:hypothetical protein